MAAALYLTGHRRLGREIAMALQDRAELDALLARQKRH
jgi:hypothetical protein